MAIISDGITDVVLDFADETYDPLFDKSVRTSTSGRLKAQFGGERFQISVKARVTQTQFRAVINLLKSGSDSYFYTPGDQLTSLYPDIEYPIQVDLDKLESFFDNKKIFYIKFAVRSTGYV